MRVVGFRISWAGRVVGLSLPFAQLHKLVKHLVLTLRRDADAGVGHAQQHRAAAQRGMQPHLALPGVAQRVAEQVTQDALQQHRVGVHRQLSSALNLEAKAQAQRGGHGAVLYRHPRQQGLQGHTGPGWLHQRGVQL